jgi:hypothetical protein
MNQLFGVLQSGQFVQFAYLQVLDLLSTLAFLLHGVGEANPFVLWSMRTAPNPLGGLMLVKCLGLVLALFCMQTNRQLLLSRINYFYAALIAWNLICLVIQTKA